MTSDAQDQPSGEPAARRPPVRDLLVAGAALGYFVLGFLPWASTTYDVLGRVSASGYRFSVLVPVAAVLLVAAAVWVLLPAAGRLPAAVPPSVVPLGLAALAFLLTLVVWLRSTDHGFEPVPLLALLLTVAAGMPAARSLPPELRTGQGAAPPPPAELPTGRS